MHSIAPSLATLTAALALAAAPAVAATPGDHPSYAVPAAGDDTVRGTVTSFDGHYALAVRDDRGFVARVRLHDGTIINPTGLTLAPGEQVTVLGANEGNVLSANEIDTPYPPAVVGYGYGYGYGSPYGYGYPAYGPAFDFGYRFGGFGGGFRHFR